MDALLSFFADFILFTAGVIVCLAWIVLIIAVAIELYDGIKGEKDVSDEEEMF